MRTFEGHEGPVRSVVWAPGGRFTATASNDGTIKIWDVTVGNVQDALHFYVPLCHSRREEGKPAMSVLWVGF
jgi:WD40 repeat protein